MRDVFADLLHSAMEANPGVFLVYGDIGNHLFDKIKFDFPDRYVNAGVAESNMVTLASGLAHGGLIPVCYTINSFLYLKALEQIKLDLAYPNRQVLMVGTGGGLSYGELGTSHHSLEDYSVLRSIPNLNLYSPGDPTELAMCLAASLASPKPSYMRIGKKEHNSVSAKSNAHSRGELAYRYAGSGSASIAVVSTGPISVDVAGAVASLPAEVAVDAYSAPELSPWLSSSFRAMFHSYQDVITFEEHYPHGGLFSMLAEAFASETVRPRVHRHGLDHEFITGLGNQEEIRASKGLSSRAIAEAIQGIRSG